MVDSTMRLEARRQPAIAHDKRRHA